MGAKSERKSPAQTTMNILLRAIFEDNRNKVKNQLQKNPELAKERIEEAKLYRGKIDHWIYLGDTALHLAAAGYRVEIVRGLLAAGADPNSAMNHRQSTPLHYSADGYSIGTAWNPARQVRTIRCLLDAGAAVNAQDKNGATPLHRAVRTRCAEAVRCLLQASSDPKVKNKPGSTPFHLAVQNTGRGGSGAEAAIDAQRRIIKEFLSWGVSPHLKDDKGKSVLDWARSGWIRELLSR
jgi:hypothetical protein